MPHSVEAEQAVLGAMLIDARNLPELLGLLKPDDFFIPRNREIYEAIYAMFALNQNIDPITVLAHMHEQGAGDDQALRKYMFDLMQLTPTTAHVLEYARIVRDRSLLRQVAEASADISALVMEGQGEALTILDAAEQRIFDIRHGRSDQTLYTVGEVLQEVFDRLDELLKNKGQLPGLPTGLSEVDSYIGGLGRSNLILIASRPGMGKTSIALNIALNAVRQSGKAVVFFSLEMSREQLVMRMLSGEAFIDSKKLLTGDLTLDEWNRLIDASRALTRMDLRFDDNSNINVAEMKAKCRRLKNLGLIVIDYLQLMQGSRRNENRVQEVADISRNLKIMAKELDVPVLCLSQLSRAAETRSEKNKRPMLSDLRESGAIEQDADVVMFLYRDEYYNEDTEDKNIAECIVAKNRHGATGTVRLQWIAQYTSFSSREWRHEEGAGE
ncbi:MAG: replicative DNA helicase [Oscillospiraceae bacterium]|nr:replicative DNA helicase [Oscillospiraceae bacterium]